MMLVDTGPLVALIHRDDACLPMDFADAALVRVAERERIRRVFTLDKRDFQVYRPKHAKQFILTP